MHSFDVHFTSLSKLCKYAGPKPFCWAKPACFDFSSCNFNVRDHVLSTAGDALTTTIIELKFKEQQQQQQQQTWMRIKPDRGEKQVGRREQPAADPGYSYPLQLFLFSACLPACPLLPLLLLCTRLDTCNPYKQILRTSECAQFWWPKSPTPRQHKHPMITLITTSASDTTNNGMMPNGNDSVRPEASFLQIRVCWSELIDDDRIISDFALLNRTLVADSARQAVARQTWWPRVGRIGHQTSVPQRK